jgi:hypothetical protein
MEINRKSEYVVLAIIMISLMVSIFIFVVFKDSNKILTIIATALLTLSIAVGLWSQSFSKIEPLGFSQFLMIITLTCVISSMYIANYFGAENPAIIGIAVGALVPKVLNKNLPKIRKLFSILLISNK